MRKTIIVFALSAVFFTLSACTPSPSKSWVGYVEGEYLYISSPLGGRIETLNVLAGQEVAQNAPLFSLDKEAETANIEEANARAKAARALSSNTEKGKRTEEIAVTRAQLVSAEAQASLAQNELQRQQQLLAQGFISKAKIEDATTNVKLTQARVNELKAALAVASLPARIDERTAAGANAVAAEQVLRQTNWRAKQKTEMAPQAGLISDVYFRAGEVVSAGQAVLALLPPGHVKLRFYVPEAELATVHAGDAVSIHCDGCGTPITATVTRIANQAEYTPPVIYSNAQRAKLMFLVEARPDPAVAKQLHPGQPIEVKRNKTALLPSALSEKKS
ncbi:HlyD family secretion protein [Undibacterium fentianense]|uniref:HlyD family efflux transporter periplasmic adaptor subunit n=1 Tax=Undibacterium fentianense TaxID=2828728 RepID=A0A941E4H8_9BURK|nr:HlyD family efflux transporter periplasmic adaptor subunit [Undibacterium fentianense]MBR7801381.1 HlyD family efflux transporter periplasmic adaptor subunit [Undibacterium fentianense]